MSDFNESEFVTQEEFDAHADLLAGTVRSMAQLGDVLNGIQGRMQGLLALIFDPRIELIRSEPEALEMVAEINAGQFDMIDQHLANIRARLNEVGLEDEEDQ